MSPRLASIRLHALKGLFLESYPMNTVTEFWFDNSASLTNKINTYWQGID